MRGAIEVARDITERKRAEEELRENEKKYRSLYQEFQGILNAMPDIVCLLSPDLRIVWANDVTAPWKWTVSPRFSGNTAFPCGMTGLSPVKIVRW